MIEARGVGLLKVPLIGRTKLSLVVDMDNLASDRLPGEKTMEISGQRIKVIEKFEGPHFPAAILLYLTHMFSG